MTKTFKWILAALWTAFIIYGLTRTPSETPRFAWLTIEGVDKLVHAILFGVEAYLLYWAVERKHRSTVFFAVVGWCVLLGGALEVVQFYWIEGRSGDMMDLLADAIGALIGTRVLTFSTKNN